LPPALLEANKFENAPIESKPVSNRVKENLNQSRRRKLEPTRTELNAEKRRKTHKTRAKRVVYMKKENSPGNLDVPTSKNQNQRVRMMMAKLARKDPALISSSPMIKEEGWRCGQLRRQPLC
jgi:hypothetical protein